MMSRLLFWLALAVAVALGGVRLWLAWKLRDAVAGIPWDEIRRVSKRGPR